MMTQEEKREAAKLYKSKLSPECKRIYEILLRGLTNHQDIIVIPTELTPTEDLTAVITRAVDLDNPQLYFVNYRELKILPLDRPDIIKCWGIYGSYYMSEETRVKTDRLIADEISKVLDEAIKEKTEIERYWRLYNWLLKRCSTGWCEDYEDVFPDAASSIFGPLILKETMCEGYAKAFKFLFDKLNGMLPANHCYECAVVADYTNDHAWNVIVNNKDEAEILHCDLAYEPDDEKLQGRCFMISEEERREKQMIDTNNTHVINGNVCINGDLNMIFNSIRSNCLYKVE